MNIEKLPDELNMIIDSYCYEKCKFCNNSTTNFDFCSIKCYKDYNAEFVDFIDFLIVLISSGLIIFKFIDYIIEPFNVMIVVFLYFILIPSWIISNMHVICRGVISKRNLKEN